MVETDDKKFMKRCLELASKAEGLTYPNPMVGCVIVNNRTIIGEGFHLKSGGPHAEVIAIGSVSDKSKLKTSTLYVNLEPCSHYGKTPPCADFIISFGIPRIVIGTLDTSDNVSGEGALKLKNAGCDVLTGVLEKECRSLNRRFFTYNEKKRPYITLKWAQSADGYLDVFRSENLNVGPNWITGKPERVLVHKWRASEKAILIGAETARKDSPKLTVREWSGNNPLKIILSSSGFFGNNPDGNESTGKTIVFTHKMGTMLPNAFKVKLDDKLPSSGQVTEYLYKQGIQSLFIEGGAKVLEHFIASGFWDEARVFTGKKFFHDGIKAPSLKGTLLSTTTFSDSFLEIFSNNSS